LLHKILQTSYPISYSQHWKVLSHYVQNWQNYATFTRGHSTFWPLMGN